MNLCAVRHAWQERVQSRWIDNLAMAKCSSTHGTASEYHFTSAGSVDSALRCAAGTEGCVLFEQGVNLICVRHIIIDACVRSCAVCTDTNGPGMGHITPNDSISSRFLGSSALLVRARALSRVCVCVCV